MLNISGLDFLALVLQSSNSFDLKAFFQVLFSLNLTVYKGHIQLLFLGAVCSTGLFGQAKSFFFVWNLQTVFTLKAIFSEVPSFFVIFVCKYDALTLHLHVVVLLASVTKSWPSKTRQMLNISGLDFLALVLQSSNSFDLKAFFQVLFSLILTVYKGQIQLLFLGAVCSTGLFGQAKSVLFSFSSEIIKRFSRWKPFFRKVLHFYPFCL